MNAVDSLPCSTIVYRTITRASDFDKDQGRALANAFHRRQRDLDGVSVDYGLPPSECGLQLAGRRAVVSLHVGRVRNIGLDVVPNHVPNHANIVGMPFREHDSDRAEKLAKALATQARVAWRADASS